MILQVPLEWPQIQSPEGDEAELGHQVSQDGLLHFGSWRMQGQELLYLMDALGAVFLLWEDSGLESD